MRALHAGASDCVFPSGWASPAAGSGARSLDRRRGGHVCGDGAFGAVDVRRAGAEVLACSQRDVALGLDAAAGFGAVAAAQVVAPVPGQIQAVGDVDGDQIQVAPGTGSQQLGGVEDAVWSKTASELATVLAR